MESYFKIKELGNGSFGKVCMYTRKICGENVVIKEIPIDINNEVQMQKKQNEVLVLAMLNHPNIIRYFDSFICEQHLNIVMEYAIHGTLHDYLTIQENYLSQQEVLFKFCQIIMALDHMHENNILHRDLKAENVMLTGLNGRVVKLTDFGISKILSSSDTKTQTLIGTPNYISPEVCMGTPYGRKADIWALGCILYELCALRRMFEGPVATMVSAITQAQLKTIHLGIYSPKVQELIEIMCNIDPSARPGTDLLMTHRLLIPVIYKIMVNLGSVLF